MGSHFDLKQNSFVVIYFILIQLNLSFDFEAG